MLSRLFAAGCVLALGLLTGCDPMQDGSLASSPNRGETGLSVARLRVDLGRPGMLARAAQMVPKRLILQFMAYDSSFQLVREFRDTLEVTGYGAWSEDYSLETGALWRVRAEAFDQNGQILHSGYADFQVEPGKTSEVDLRLDALYSSARFSFPVGDSMSRFVVKIDGEVRADTSVVRQSKVGGAVDIDLDYIDASARGVVHLVSLYVYGEMWGMPTMLFALEDTVRFVSGAFESRQLLLGWVGPLDPPATGAGLAVQLGRVGSVRVQAAYQDTARGWLGDGVFSDSRTGFVYRWKRIGSQVWMTRNIGPDCASDTCRSGSLFRDSSRDEEGLALADFRSACPAGWHVPDTSEWANLVRFVGGGESDSVGAYRLRAVTSWTGRTGVPSYLVPRLWDLQYVSFNGDDRFGFGVFPHRIWIPNLRGVWWHEAELWTSTPGCSVVRFDPDGFTACADFREVSPMMDYQPVAPVRCVKDAP